MERNHWNDQGRRRPKHTLRTRTSIQIWSSKKSKCYKHQRKSPSVFPLQKPRICHTKNGWVPEDHHQRLQTRYHSLFRHPLFCFCSKLPPYPTGNYKFGQLLENSSTHFQFFLLVHPKSEAINTWATKHTEWPLFFPWSLEQTLKWIYNLRITYQELEIYLEDNNVMLEYKQ